MKVFNIVICFMLLPVVLQAQSFNDETTSLSNYIKRLYEAQPFEGVKIIEDYDNAYMISVVTVDKSKYPNDALAFRVAGAKSMSQMNDYLNGVEISSKDIIRMNANSDGSKDSSVISEIRVNGFGYVKAMELLLNFQKPDNPSIIVCVYNKKIVVPESNKPINSNKKKRKKS